jgi:hypothetical protein
MSPQQRGQTEDKHAQNHRLRMPQPVDGGFDLPNSHFEALQPVHTTRIVPTAASFNGLRRGRLLFSLRQAPHKRQQIGAGGFIASSAFSKAFTARSKVSRSLVALSSC